MRAARKGTALVACLSAAALSAGCGGGSGSSKPAAFVDGFDGYEVKDWTTPPDGWESLSGKNWYVTDSTSVSGNSLWFVSNDDDWLVREYGAADFTESVQISYQAIIPYLGGAYGAGLVGRLSDASTYYSVDIETDTYYSSHPTVLLLSKFWTEGSTTFAYTMGEVGFFTGDIDSGAFYTLTLTCQGDQITARASGPGVPEKELTRTDDGTHGPVLSGSKVGVYGLAEVSFHPYFDNFSVSAL
ncbi:MAG TPA: hypothetical protein VFG59_20600 [Anaeromyxobacter sp.]|nr:hypothetical protein [Anaeromyxobacter sp.]